MKRLKGAVTVVLLLFVGATVGMLVAQEVSRPPSEAMAGAASPERSVEERDEAASVPSKEPLQEEVGIASAAGDEVTLPESEEDDADAAPVESVTASQSAEPACIVDAIYFHNTLRCRTCRNIEETAHAVMEAEFSGAFAAGRLRWMTANMEEKQHFVEQYDLVKPTLILLRSVDGEAQDWIALDEAWSLIGRESRFSAYIVDSTLNFLGGCP